MVAWALAVAVVRLGACLAEEDIPLEAVTAGEDPILDLLVVPRAPLEAVIWALCLRVAVVV
jgi:hypothetical protein